MVPRFPWRIPPGQGGLGARSGWEERSPRFLWRAPHNQGRELGGGGREAGAPRVGDLASSSSRETWGI